MIIQCENCKRKYRLDDSKIDPPGSNVQCSKCGHIFFAPTKGVQPKEDNPVLAQQTPLSEIPNEEATEENTLLENESTKLEEKEQAVFETPTNIEQHGHEDVQEKEEEIVDIPTEHQTDLEDFIEQNRNEDIQSEDTSGHKDEEFKNDIDTNDIDKVSDPITETVVDPPDMFAPPEGEDMQLGEDGVDGEIYSDKSFDEEPQEEGPIENLENLSNIEENLDNNIQLNENTEQIDSKDTDTDIAHKTSRGIIIKSQKSILTKFIYTLITLAALFVLFIVSFVILIKAEILPKNSFPGLYNFVESVTPINLNNESAPQIIISEHKARWMNTVNGPVYIVSGLVTNRSQEPVHYIKLRSEYITADKKEYEDTFYAGNTFTDVQLKVSPIQNILSKLDQKNGDIDINNSKKLAGLNYNIQPGESIPFFTVFPADSRVLGLKYKLDVVDYQQAPAD